MTQRAIVRVKMDLDLMPCPFCGEAAKMGEDFDQDMQARIPKYFVKCSVCHARGAECSMYSEASEYTAKTRAIALWNRRTNQTVFSL